MNLDDIISIIIIFCSPVLSNIPDWRRPIAAACSNQHCLMHTFNDGTQHYHKLPPYIFALKTIYINNIPYVYFKNVSTVNHITYDWYCGRIYYSSHLVLLSYTHIGCLPTTHLLGIQCVINKCPTANDIDQSNFNYIFKNQFPFLIFKTRWISVLSHTKLLTKFRS